VSSVQVAAIVAVLVPALAVVLWPLWRRRGEAPTLLVPPDDRRLELGEEKASVYRALKELTFDYEAGHLSEDDYQGLRDRYESRAAELLLALDALGPALPRPGPRSKRPVPAPRPRPVPAGLGIRRRSRWAASSSCSSESSSGSTWGASPSRSRP
jgi:hypothetical protein